MIQQLLTPVNQEVLNAIPTLSQHSIGRGISIHTAQHFPDLNGIDIALIFVQEHQGSEKSFDIVRKQFYSLFPGDWHSKIVDLGSIKVGQTKEDTFKAISFVIEYLIKKKIVPVVLGTSQDFTYPLYRAYDKLEQMVNLVTIDSKINMVTDGSTAEDSYITKIIMEKPNNLLNFSNLGYQTYLNSQEEIDLLDKMYFDAYRLGDIIKDITLSEPVLRDADIVSFNLSSIKSSELGNLTMGNPNGFDSRESCALARYSGISDRVTSFGLFNIGEKTIGNLLISQILWYFIEGYNYRMNEYPYVSKEEYFKYIVPQETQDLIFYKSDISDRWWIEIEQCGFEKDKKKVLFPCSFSDYDRAVRGEIPERWWKLSQRML